MAEDYLAVYANTNGVAYGGTEPINSSGAGATDGTELIKPSLGEPWGKMQFALDYAGLTPNGLQESVANGSQYFESVQKAGEMPGMAKMWMGNTDPATAGIRALPMNGQGILRANYVLLDAACYVGDAENENAAAVGGAFYRADDAGGVTPNIVGIYLILPETRGYAPRGLDLAASVDPLGAARYLGDNQIDAKQGSIHFTGLSMVTGDSDQAVYATVTTDIPGNATSRLSGSVGGSEIQTTTSVDKNDGTNGTPRTSSETRMSNFSVNWIIFY